MNIELRKNAEGYTDPTAGATLNQKEPGDIWTYNGDACLIIKNHGKFSTILLLKPLEAHPRNVQIMTKSGPMYADQRLLTYGLHVKMARYIETVSVEDFKRVIEAVEAAVGLSLLVNVEVTNTAPSDEAAKLLELSGQVATLREQLEEDDITIQGLERQLIAAQSHVGSAAEKAIAQAQAEATKARNQLELLREMYNDLLAKVVGGVVSNAN